MNLVGRHRLVLAIYPNARGFAFVVFEGPFAPVDWGTMVARGAAKNRQCIRRVGELFSRFQPDVVVLQDMSTTPRARRIQRLNEAIAMLGETQGIILTKRSREDVRKQFEYLHSPTKHQIAIAIARHVPAFERLLPPVRKPWMSESGRMGIFDAAALIFAFFGSSKPELEQ